MANEGLALACASIGALQEDDDGNELYVKNDECLESLKDLQRYLRRDHPETRDIFLQLGKWNVVRHDLIPLIKRYSDDLDVVLNCVKVLVFLTMPLGPAPHQASLQIEYLLQYRAAIVEGDAIAVIVSHLEGPLEHLENECPTEDDWKMFQLFLTLLRNFLSIPDSVPHQSQGIPQLSNLRDELLERLFNESVLELVVALTQHVAGRGALRQDNLLFLEIIHHVFRSNRPDAVAAAEKGAKLHNNSGKAAALQAFFEAEEEQRRRSRDGTSPFLGTFVKVARDGTKTILTKNPHQSPLENLARKPQIKRGYVKRIVQEEVKPVLSSPDHVYVLLKDFADQFLASGYNVLMQSVKQDIRRERSDFDTADVVTFFQVAQYFTSYQCCLAQRKQRKSKGRSLDGADSEASGQKQLCGLISSTMDEEMFTLVISKWHEYADSAATTKDWGPQAAAGGTVKDMIRMLDIVLKRSGCFTKEAEQEVRTARILLYKAFYDQTESGIIHFVKSLMKSFDIYKQPRSHLADLVEITHVVLRILDNFVKSGEDLRVLKKVHGGKKKKNPAVAHSDQPQKDEGEQAATDLHGGENAAEVPASLSPVNNVENETQNLNPELSDHVESLQDKSETDGDAHEPAVDLDKADREGEEEFLVSAPRENDEEDSDGEKPQKTKEVSLDVHRAVGEFADNVVVRNYCWLLKFFSSNRATTNHYIVRMLQRICDDCMLEPILYQVSILQTFYSVLSNRQVQAAEDHRYVVAFLTKLMHRMFKKIKAHPILFVELLFWKTRQDCHHITVDYMLHSLRKGTGAASAAPSAWKRANIADALGDDEDDTVPPTRPEAESDDAEVLSDDDLQDPASPDEIHLFSEDQETQIKDLFERYKNDDNKAELIAINLDAAGKYTGDQVMRKLRQLQLIQRPAKKASQKIAGRGRAAETLPSSVALERQKTKKLKKKSEHSAGDTGPKRSRLFSEAQDEELREQFSRLGNGKGVVKVIAQNLGGVFTTAQISRRIRALGLVKVKPKPPHSSLNDNLSDSEDDNPMEGDAGQDMDKPTRSRREKTIGLSDSEDDLVISSSSGPAVGRRQKLGDKEGGKQTNSDSDDILLSSLNRPAAGGRGDNVSNKEVGRRVVDLDSEKDLSTRSRTKSASGEKQKAAHEKGVKQLDAGLIQPKKKRLNLKAVQGKGANVLDDSAQYIALADSEGSDDDLPLNHALAKKDNPHGRSQKNGVRGRSLKSAGHLVNEKPRTETTDIQGSDDDMPLSLELARKENSLENSEGTGSAVDHLDSDDDLPLGRAIARKEIPVEKSQKNLTPSDSLSALAMKEITIEKSQKTFTPRDRLNFTGDPKWASSSSGSLDSDDELPLGGVSTRKGSPREKGLSFVTPAHSLKSAGALVNGRTVSLSKQNHVTGSGDLEQEGRSLTTPVANGAEVSNLGLHASWGLSARKRVQALDTHDEDNAQADNGHGLFAAFSSTARRKQKGVLSQPENSPPAVVLESDDEKLTTETPHFDDKPGDFHSAGMSDMELRKGDVDLSMQGGDGMSSTHLASSHLGQNDEGFEETVPKRRKLTKSPSLKKSYQDGELQFGSKFQAKGRRIAKKVPEPIAEVASEFESLFDF